MGTVLWLVMSARRGTAGLDIKPEKEAQGPYSFSQSELTLKAPTREMITLNMVSIGRNVQLALMERAYCSSYCYNGGSLDPNTGCSHGLVNEKPTMEKA